MSRYINCPECKRKNVRHYAKGLCNKCYRKNKPKEKCSSCGEKGRVEKRGKNGEAICAKCYEKDYYEKPKEKCFICGETNIIKKRGNNGRAICPKCYEHPLRICDDCGKRKPAAKNLNNNKYLCINCYKEKCIECGEIGKPHIRKKEGAICEKCYNKNHYKKPKEKCLICEEIKEVKKRSNNGKPICNKCYVKEKHKNDELFYIKGLLRVRLFSAFHRYSTTGKIMKSKDYGINYKAIIQHLGPCPGQREGYHIDHVFPLSAFDFNNLTHIRLAFAPENHQWLRKEENLSKNAKYDEEHFKEYINANV